MRRPHSLSLLFSCLLLASLTMPRSSFGLIIDFETLSDSDTVTNQFAANGVLFSNTTALTAGVSLNEFEFPPKSGSNVVSDDGGPITIDFSVLVSDVKGFFTYTVPLTFTAFDALLNPVGIAMSGFSSNLALSGDLGSNPNELLQFAFNDGISRVVIQGDPSGGSFTLDDVTFNPVPEPSTLLLVGSGLAGLIRWKRGREVRRGSM